MPDLSKVGVRNHLAVRREPHWHRLWVGCFVGYRPSRRSQPGTWIARVFDPTSKKYKLKALGRFDDLPGNHRFAAAKDAAEQFAAKLRHDSVAGRRPDAHSTVADDSALDPTAPNTKSLDHQKLFSEIRLFRTLGW